MVKVIKRLNEYGIKLLVQHRGQYFVVSNVNVPFSGRETLVFASDENGNITNWQEIVGGRGVSPAEAIKQLEAVQI